MSIEDEIDDDMIGRVARSLGLGSSGSGPRAPCRYEAIGGHGDFHVMRVTGQRRETVRIVPTRADADYMIKVLEKADREARG